MPPKPSPAATVSLGKRAASPLAFGAEHIVEILLIAVCCGVLVYFFAFFKIFTNGLQTTWEWARAAWNPENNQEHSIAVLPIAVGLVCWHWNEIKAARKSLSWAGLPFLALGVGMFLLAARCLQPRFALCALPLLIYGGVRFVWGRETSRVFIFPCLFLLFMIPVGGFVQGTVSLQLFVSSAVKALSALAGVHIQTIGTTLRALDGSFDFEVAEGCSGIRSLMAMTMLSALYVHFTQKQAWKQVAIFLGSVLFAMVGNIGRVFSVILVARFISVRLAGNLYHDYSGFLFFPIAVLAMMGFSQLLNHDWRRADSGEHDVVKRRVARNLAPGGEASPERPRQTPVSYDY